MSETYEAIDRAYRRLEPELHAKMDKIAAIIDPEAFAHDEWFDGSGPGAKPVGYMRTRRAYMQSKARCTAWHVLKALGIAPEYEPWPEIFEDIQREARELEKLAGQGAPLDSITAILAEMEREET